MLLEYFFYKNTKNNITLQIQGDGRGYQCLVALTKTHESVSLKCLMNLCYLSSCRPMLGIAGLVECLVVILQKHSGINIYEYVFNIIINNDIFTFSYVNKLSLI